MPSARVLMEKNTRFSPTSLTLSPTSASKSHFTFHSSLRFTKYDQSGGHCHVSSRLNFLFFPLMVMVNPLIGYFC